MYCEFAPGNGGTMLGHRKAGMRQRFRTAAFIVLACGIFATPALADDTPAPSNLDLMTDMSSAIANELSDKFLADLEGRGVQLKPFSNDERYQFLVNIFTSTFTAKGLTVYQSNVTGELLYSVEFQALTFDLKYPKVYRSWLFGGKRVKRRASVTILATVYDPATGSVVWVGQGTRESVDEFPHGDVARVQEGTFNFARPELPTSGWSKLVEPVFVGGIVVGLIYLFFSNQNSGTS